MYPFDSDSLIIHQLTEQVPVYRRFTCPGLELHRLNAIFDTMKEQGTFATRKCVIDTFFQSNGECKCNTRGDLSLVDRFSRHIQVSGL